MNKNEPAVLITESSIVLILNSKRLIAHKGHPLFSQIKQRIKDKNYDGIEGLFNVKNTIESSINVQIKNNQILYKGQVVNNAICKSIFEYLKEGIETTSLLNFLDRLLTKNPSKKSVDQLWEYVSRYNFPICADGCFLATKVVSNNWHDKYSGKIRNMVGDKPSMPRNQISEETEGDFCNSQGLYCGDLDGYVLGYYGYGNDRVVVVKVAPEHAVACPQDKSYMKIRVHEYEVTDYLGTVDELKGKNLVKFTHNSVTNTNDNWRSQARDNSGRFIKS